VANFLSLVNRTLELLRFDAVSTLAGSADPTTLVMAIVNRSARTVLEHRIWSFLVRDAQIRVPRRVSRSGAVVASDGSITFPEADISQATLGDTFTSWHLCVTEDANYGETFFQIVSFQTALGGHVPTLSGVGLLSPYAAGTNLDYVLIPNMRKFPNNVRQVLSVRHQQEPLEVIQESRNDLNALLPDWHDDTGEPEIVVIGGLTSPTFNASLSGGSPIQSQIFGPRMLIWPAPTVVTILDLDVVWRHPEMTVDADSLTGVPEHINDLIVLRSAVDGLLGQVVSDAERGRALAQRYEIELGRAVNQDQLDPNRRRIPVPFGNESGIRTRERWERRTISGSWSGVP